jgi:hypothetical protein
MGGPQATTKITTTMMAGDRPIDAILEFFQKERIQHFFFIDCEDGSRDTHFSFFTILIF